MKAERVISPHWQSSRWRDWNWQGRELTWELTGEGTDIPRSAFSIQNAPSHTSIHTYPGRARCDSLSPDLARRLGAVSRKDACAELQRESERKPKWAFLAYFPTQVSDGERARLYLSRAESSFDGYVRLAESGSLSAALGSSVRAG